jgi:DNA polymerase elongation subunit (family B)
MYLAAYYDYPTGKFHLWDDTHGYINFDFQKYAYRKDKNGTHIAIDGTRVTRTTRWTSAEVHAGDIYEADILPTTRVLNDLYKEDESPSKGCNVGFWDIETEILQGFPNWRNPINKITGVAFFDKSNNQHYAFILDEHRQIERTDQDNVSIIPCATEEILIKSFLTTYREARIHILTDWNGDIFDVPYFYNRTLAVLGEEWANMLSPIGQVNFDEKTFTYEIAGLAHLDYLRLYKKFSIGERGSYRLNDIGLLEVNLGKIHYEGTLDTLYKTDIHKFVQYNLNDNFILEALENKLKYIDLSRDQCHTSHVAYQDIFKSTRVIDGGILTYAKLNNLVVPTKPATITGIRNTEKAEGAFVKDPVVGRYRWVVDFDATSLYPSIIRSLNISSETKIFTVLSEHGISLSDLIDNQDYTIKMSNGSTKKVTGKKIKDVVIENKFAFSCNGVAYNTTKRGLIAQVLDDWFAKRKEYTALHNKYMQEGNTELAEFYDRRQYNQKILINSVYGALLESGFRYYDMDNGESVTRTGKRIILFGEIVGNQYCKDMTGKDIPYVVYCDTDSLFIKLEDVLTHFNINLDDDAACKAKINEMIPPMQKYINTEYNRFCKDDMNLTDHFIEFKQEYIIKSALWVKKKNYAMWLVNKKGHDMDKIDVKGLSVVRSSFAPAFRTNMNRVLKDMLYYVEQDVIEVYLREFEKAMVDQHVYQIANPTSLKDIDKWLVKDKYVFKTGTPVHVKAAIQHNWFIELKNLGKKYPKFVNGDKIKWVYLHNNPLGLESIAMRGYEDPQDLIDYAEKYRDYTKTYNRTFVTKIQALYTAIGWGIINLNENKNIVFEESDEWSLIN